VKNLVKLSLTRKQLVPRMISIIYSLCVCLVTLRLMFVLCIQSVGGLSVCLCVSNVNAVSEKYWTYFHQTFGIGAFCEKVFVSRFLASVSQI